MKKIVSIYLIWICGPSALLGQEQLSNRAYDASIQTAQVYPIGNPLADPIIGLNSGEQLEFHFDQMDGDLETYYYGAIHCDHNWYPSDLEATEYLQGFPSSRIEEAEHSFGAMYNYVHYQFIFPGDMSKPRYSGNYIMVVSSSQDLSQHDEWLLTYRFIVYEMVANLVAQTKPSSVIADRFKKQQIDCTVYHKDFRIFDPMRDVSISLIQNMHWSGAISNLKPVFIKMEELTFDYNSGQNSFFGGTEWRNFEVKNINYASNEVEYITYEANGYQVYLRTDLPQGGRAASHGIDINGNFLIRNDLGDNSNLEAEYVWVHFFLEMAEIPESSVIIEGRFTAFNEQPLFCHYDAVKKGYVAKALLKQGYYNYRYAIRDNYRAQDDITYTEGSDAQTENEYLAVVYYADPNWGCDRIIALRSINTVKRK